MPTATVFDALNAIIPLGDLTRLGNVKLESPGFMDLVVELLETRGDRLRISLAHYYEQNGDLCPDPDLEVEVNLKTKSVRPLAIQMSTGHYTRAVDVDAQGRETVNARAVRDLTTFLRQWVANLKEQGFQYRESDAQPAKSDGDPALETPKNGSRT
jgi:hypothetical protein